MDFSPAFLICLLTFPVFGDNTSGRSRSCADVRHFYSGKGFSLNGVPDSEISGEHLRICPQGYTCCTSEMEEQLSNQGRWEVEQLAREAGQALLSSLQSQYRSFDGYFLELLNHSESSVLQSLRGAGGNAYAQNAHLVQGLFAELRRYYRGSGVNLEESLNEFWAQLLERMLKASNPQRGSGDDFLECAGKQAEVLRPFGDVPRDLKAKVTRAFVVARSFSVGLLVSSDVVRKVSQVPLSPECARAIMRLTYCPHCRGLGGVKPCTRYCRNVMKGCLANQADLDPEWTNLADAMVQVAERFRGPVGVENFILSLPLRLSEAISSMQENADIFRRKVLQACGSPSEAATGSSETEETKKAEKALADEQTIAVGGLEKLVLDVSRKLKDLQHYWVQLPNALCNDKVTAGDDSCWNGMTRARYLPEVMGDGLASQINNPEVDIDITKPDMTIRQQIMQLKITTNRLRNAFDGNDVDFQDTSDDASGSGSGMRGDDLCPQHPCVSITRAEHPQIHASPVENKAPQGSGSQSRPCASLLLLSLVVLLLRR
ncbi:glypican-1-like [Brienomyrus brachyistius]|uniref:glypican-1-like n=1 Tax=Brienomyrus brachyistius TaxID=42636 RepID=UPI0020B26DF5|nr:glypican-1-like [Brienomyrus brachyistius]